MKEYLHLLLIPARAVPCVAHRARPGYNATTGSANASSPSFLASVYRWPDENANEMLYIIGQKLYTNGRNFRVA